MSQQSRRDVIVYLIEECEMRILYADLLNVGGSSVFVVGLEE